MDKMIPLHCIYRLMSKHNIKLVNEYDEPISLNWFCKELNDMKMAEEENQELGDPEREVMF